MSRDWRLYWSDILVACQKVQRYTAGLDLEGLIADERTYDAVLRNLEIIGEAAKAIPKDSRDLAPSVDWRGIVGLRDVLAHAYFSISDRLLWVIITSKVPELHAAMNSANIDSDDPSDDGTA